MGTEPSTEGNHSSVATTSNHQLSNIIFYAHLSSTCNLPRQGRTHLVETMDPARLVVLLLLCCVSHGREPAARRPREVDALLRAAHLVRAVGTEARENVARRANGGARLEDAALAAFAHHGSQLPRWALLHALAEEHERLSWREDATGAWHGARAACLYGTALSSPALARLHPSDFSALFNRSALAMQRLLPRPVQPKPASHRSTPGPAATAAVPAAEEQVKQCAATRVEYERWRGKRDDVTNFALGSAFHPLRVAGGLEGQQTVHIDDVRQSFRSASLHDSMRPVVEKLWPDFSPDSGAMGGSAHALMHGLGTDLRHVLEAVQRWRKNKTRADKVSVFEQTHHPHACAYACMCM